MIRGGLFWLVTVASTFFFSSLALVFALFRAAPGAFDWIHRNWARALLAAAGVKLDVEGLEHVDTEGPQVLVANHQSMVDIWALMAVVPVSIRFVAKVELSRIPIFGAATRAGGHVFIDRSRASRAADAIREGIERMRRDNLTLALFPEGTRSGPDGELGRFLRGSFALAIETQTRLVPVAIDGGRDVLPRGARRPRPGVVTLRFAPAVPLAGTGPEDRDALLQETRDAISSMLAARDVEPEAADRAG